MAKVTQAHILARKSAILDAAVRAFVRKGVEGARMEDIAAEAGLSAGAIYRYYPSKESLLRAVLRDCIEQNRAMFDQADTSAGSPLAALVRLGHNFWSRMKSEEARTQTLLGLESILASVRYAEELAIERRRMREELIERLARLLHQAQAAGEIDPAIDVRSLSLMLLACVTGLGLMLLDLGDDLDTEGVLAVLIEVLRRSAPTTN